MYLAIALSHLGDAENTCNAFAKALELDRFGFRSDAVTQSYDRRSGSFLINLNFAVTLLQLGDRPRCAEQYNQFVEKWSRLDETQQSAVGNIRCVQRNHIVISYMAAPCCQDSEIQAGGSVRHSTGVTNASIRRQFLLISRQDGHDGTGLTSSSATQLYLFMTFLLALVESRRQTPTGMVPDRSDANTRASSTPPCRG